MIDKFAIPTLHYITLDYNKDCSQLQFVGGVNSENCREFGIREWSELERSQIAIAGKSTLFSRPNLVV